MITNHYGKTEKGRFIPQFPLDEHDFSQLDSSLRGHPLPDHSRTDLLDYHMSEHRKDFIGRKRRKRKELGALVCLTVLCFFALFIDSDLVFAVVFALIVSLHVMVLLLISGLE